MYTYIGANISLFNIFSYNKYHLLYINPISPETFSVVKDLLQAVISTPSNEKQFQKIDEEIKKINRKIIILVDDLDRLDKKEIYEVIRLIRNTASFSNTFFIVAYDRNYVLNAIEEINAYQSHRFLEKIFQFEFTLTPIDKVIIEREIGKLILPLLSSKDKREYEKMTLNNDFHSVIQLVNLTSAFVFSMRDVIRFVNSFSIYYVLVQGEIDFIDFYNLELIRFKHPEIFQEVYRNQSQFFYAGRRENFYPPPPLTYALTKSTNSTKKK